MISFRQSDLLETVKYRGKKDATVQYAFVFEKTWQNEDGTGTLKRGPNGELEAWCSVEIGNIQKTQQPNDTTDDPELRSRIASKLRQISDADPLRNGAKVNAKPNMTLEDLKQYIIDFYKPKFQQISPTPVEQKFTDVGGSFWLFFNFTVKMI